VELNRGAHFFIGMSADCHTDVYIQLSTDYWDIHMFEPSHVTAIIFKQG